MKTIFVVFGHVSWRRSPTQVQSDGLGRYEGSRATGSGIGLLPRLLTETFGASWLCRSLIELPLRAVSELRFLSTVRRSFVTASFWCTTYAKVERVPAYERGFIM